MTAWPAAPVVYEVDTWPWLTDLRRRYGTAYTLADLPPSAWDAVTPPGVDAVWLMGVWQRSPAGLAIAVADPGLGSAFRAALPDLVPDDIVGSPYCVPGYTVDERLGGPAGLAAARAELAGRGVRLILDFVPNHVAPDHPAIRLHPEFFVTGTPAQRAQDPGAWFDLDGLIVAHGRDPYFAPWPDVVQLNAFRPALRQSTVDTMVGILDQCDGLRCDMAMLMTNDVFARTWGAIVGDPPAAEFWPEVIGRLRQRCPDAVLIAEAYWDTEWTLQQQGFDFCYDKRLYDRVLHEDADSVRGHLAAGIDYQRRLVRFTENHDEQRVAAVVPDGRVRAAAVTIATVPGATLWHEGQFEGRRTQVPVFLGRRPDEPAEEDLRAFHERLLGAAGELRHGDWRPLDAQGWPDNQTARDLLAWGWHDDQGDLPHHVVVVNLAGHASQARVPLPWDALRGRSWRLVDLLDGRAFDRAGDELVAPGLFVDLPPWGFHVLAVLAATSG